MSDSTKAIEEEIVDIQSDRPVVFEEALEAILFAAGHPITYATLARVFALTPGQIKDKVADYALIYNNSEIPRGVVLLTFKDECQLCTKEYYLTEIRSALGIRKSGTLSTSSLEALAIVAYNQPVTRAFVDTLRRADSSYAMNNLIDRGLIECKGRLDVPGRPMLYGTTSDFLRCFGLESLSKLPTTTEEIIETFRRIKNHEIEEKSEDIFEGAEQIAISDDVLDEITSLNDENSDEAASITSEEETIPAETVADDGEPSADDYQDLGE